jgi:iron(III) transport system permease protein
VASTTDVAISNGIAPPAPAASGVPRPSFVGGQPRPPYGLVLIGVVIALLFAAPTIYLVWRNIDLGADMRETITSRRTLEPLGRTLMLASAVAATAAIVGTFLAWMTMRSDIPFRRWWRILAPLPLVIPSFVGAAAFLTALAPGGLLAQALEPLGIDQTPRLHGFFGAWLVLSLFTYPYVYLPVAVRLASLPPSLEESARLLGRRPFAVFRSVVLPQTAPAIWAGGLLVFLYTVSDFGAVELMRYGTLTREIFARRLDPSTALPLSLVLAVVALAVVAGERWLGRRRARVEATRVRRSLEVPLGRWRWPAFAATIVVFGLALLAPVTVLAVWAARGLGSGGSGSVELTTDAGQLAAPAFNTISVSLVAAICAVALVLPAAYLTTRYRSRMGGATNAVVVGGFALPGLVIALALVFWVLGADFASALYQTLPVLVFAYVIHFGAQAMRASQVTVASVPRRLDDAARMLGAHRVRRFRTVELPLMLPGLAAGAGLVLLSTMKELPATLLLAPPNFETLATRIWSANESNYFAQVGLASLLLLALSGALTWVLVVRRGDRVA